MDNSEGYKLLVALMFRPRWATYFFLRKKK
jgi:hypothetical protein